MGFQKTVLISAAVILLISLIFISIVLYNSKYNAKFPPVDTYCPDYWSLSEDANGPTCNNDYSLGTCRDDDSFNTVNKFPNGLCDMFKWTEKCKVTWQGVSNAKNPCGENN